MAQSDKKLTILSNVWESYLYKFFEALNYWSTFYKIIIFKSMFNLMFYWLFVKFTSKHLIHFAKEELFFLNTFQKCSFFYFATSKIILQYKKIKNTWCTFHNPTVFTWQNNQSSTKKQTACLDSKKQMLHYKHQSARRTTLTGGWMHQ